MGLYKYVVPGRIDILKGGYIRFTHPSALNDPFEVKPYFKLFKPTPTQLDELQNSPGRIIRKRAREKYNALPPTVKATTSYQDIKNETERNFPERLRLLLSDKPEDVEKVREHVWDRLDARTGVLSLTRNPFNLLMWAHYAQNHQGFVIEFDEHHPYFNRPHIPGDTHALVNRRPSDESGYLRDVKYERKRPIFETTLDMTPVGALLVKSTKWRYEREVRMFQALEKCKNISGDVHLFKIPMTCVKGIIVGANMSPADKQEILNTLKSSKRFSHIQVSHMVLAGRTFALRKVNGLL